MQPRSILLATALIAASACGKKSEKRRADEQPPPVETEAPAEDCDAKVEAISARVAPYAEGIRTLVPPKSDLPLPASKAARPLDRGGPVVTVRRHMLELAGQRLGSVDALTERLVAERRFAELGTNGTSTTPAPVYYQVEPSLVLAALAPVVRASPEGTATRLLVARTTAREPYVAPENASQTARALLEGLKSRPDPSESATFLAQTMEKAIGTCTPLVRLFGTLAGLAPDDKLRTLMSDFGPALRECDCRGVDLDVFEVFLLEISGAHHEAQGWLPLELDAQGRLGHGLGLGDAATLGDLVAALDQPK